MLCLADHMDKVVLFVAEDIVARDVFVTQATIEADVFSITVTGTHSSIFHRCTQPSAKILVFSRLTCPALLTHCFWNTRPRMFIATCKFVFIIM